jgi:hypothetical protein
MAMIRIVDGRPVQPTAEEEAAVREDRAREVAKPAPWPKEVPTLLRYDESLARGMDLDAKLTGRVRRRFELSNSIRITDQVVVQFALSEGHDPPEPFLQQLFRDVEARRLAGETEGEA